MNVIDVCLEILSKTRDGDDLSPRDLHLVQTAVNSGWDGLSDLGKQMIQDLHKKALAGYSPPYLNDVEHITMDHEGYIYWKGKHIEHFDRPYAYTEDGRDACIELKRRCEKLEAAGIPVNCTNVIWRWDKATDFVEQKCIS